MSLESLTFSGVSVEYFGVFKGFSVTSFSFHFGVTMEFSIRAKKALFPCLPKGGFNSIEKAMMVC